MTPYLRAIDRALRDLTRRVARLEITDARQRNTGGGSVVVGPGSSAGGSGGGGTGGVPPGGGGIPSSGTTTLDAVLASDRWKQPVRVATTGAVTLATGLENGDTVDGVVLATGDRILVKDQAAGAENGIYVVEGTTNGGAVFRNTNTTAPTLGSTSITFAVLSSGAGGSAPEDDERVWVPLTTVVGGLPELVWDADDSLIPTLVPLE